MERRSIEKLQVEADRVTAALKERVDLYVAGLHGARGLFAASNAVERTEWSTFVHGMDLTRRYPGASGLFYLKRIKTGEAAPFPIYPAQDRPEHYPITFLESAVPAPGEQSKLFGYDYAAEPIRRAATERARDTGEISATALLVSILGNVPAFNLLLPVYENGRAVGTVEERRAALAGFVGAALRSDIFFDSVFRGISTLAPGLKIEIYDGDARSDDRRYYPIDASSSADADALAIQTVLPVAGERWTLAYSAAPGFGLTAFERTLPVAVLLLGILIGTIASLLTLLITASGARGRLFGAFILPLIPALAVALFSTADIQGITRRAMEQSARQTVRLISANQNLLLKKGEDFLESFGTSPAISVEDWIRCSERAAALLRANEEYANLGVVDLTGTLVCSALPFEGSVSLADRPAIIKTFVTKKFSVGEFQIGKLSKEAAVNIALPVTDRNGALRGVAFASLRISYLDNLLKNLNLPNGTVAGIIDRNGTLIARYPNSEAWVGKNISSEPLTRAMLSRGVGADFFTGLDGIERYYTFEQLSSGRDADAIVYVGLEKRIAFADVYEIAMRNAFVVGLLSLISILAAVVALRFALKLKPF